MRRTTRNRNSQYGRTSHSYRVRAIPVTQFLPGAPHARTSHHDGSMQGYAYCRKPPAFGSTIPLK
jgi:hypothetical protein